MKKRRIDNYVVPAIDQQEHLRKTKNEGCDEGQREIVSFQIPSESA